MIGKNKKKLRHTHLDTSYLGSVYDDKRFAKTVRCTLARLRALLKDKNTRFGAIAFRGSSGAALAFIASHALGIPLMHVRKSSDGNHFDGAVEGVIGHKRYVIIDDFISSGHTVKSIVSTIEHRYQKGGWPEPECIGVVLYASSADYVGHYDGNINLTKFGIQHGRNGW